MTPVPLRAAAIIVSSSGLDVRVAAGLRLGSLFLLEVGVLSLSTWTMRLGPEIIFFPFSRRCYQSVNKSSFPLLTSRHRGLLKSRKGWVILASRGCKQDGVAAGTLASWFDVPSAGCGPGGSSSLQRPGYTSGRQWGKNLIHHTSNIN